MSLLLGLIFFLLLLPSLGRRNGWKRNAAIGLAALLATALLGGLAQWWLAVYPAVAQWTRDTDVARLWWLGPLIVVRLGFWLGQARRRGAGVAAARA